MNLSKKNGLCDAGSKVAVVTGASRGIGLAVVERFIFEGWWVLACVRSKSEELDALLEGKGQIFHIDLSDETSVINCAKDIVSSSSRIDTLVNCGGVAYGSLFSMTKMTDLKDVFQVNFYSQVLFSQYISKKMIPKRRGVIVNISSTSGIIADSGTLAYGCSKAALSHATRIMATELGRFGIRVNAVAPARVDTDMGRMMDKSAADLLDGRSAMSGEITPQDVANLIFYLSSDEARSLSGQVVRLDKGMPF